MLTVLLPPSDHLRVLCLGAHSDDIEIGCGGTILRLAQAYPNLAVDWMVFASDPTRKAEALASAHLFLHGTQTRNVRVMGFRDGFFPYIGSEIKEEFERLKLLEGPDIILTHHREDRHQDHRVISDLTWNTFRNHLILEYEIPKYDGDLGNPNLFVHLEAAIVQRKMDYLLTSFQSQAGKHWFTEDTFRSILRIRGIEANAPSRFAEGFYSRKLSL